LIDDRLIVCHNENVKKLEDKKDVEGLIFALLDEKDYPVVGQETAEALGRIGDKRAIEPLILSCGDPYLKDSGIIELAAEHAFERFKTDRRAKKALARLQKIRDRRRAGAKRNGDGTVYMIG
jgi:HEAT repeat protein